ncbi:hypothetical protein O0R52_22150 (plasmid) [Bacillus halotolerans]|uniref:Uncharacterized protein n=1 Tax=Bacillus halotolerans TaxID=260554 RepID=A0ABY7I677_9BACI|nr:hypothetical protein [Bacillus halotolerans]WAT23486.1 hypothetical protein O0R52_22150 [Bacillus halotolerans]
MSSSASVATKTDIIVQKLVNFMENKDCPTKDEGNQITQELYKEIEKTPAVSSSVSTEIMNLYAAKLNQLCDRYEQG